MVCEQSIGYLEYPLIAAIIINVALWSNLVHKQRLCLSKYANESETMQCGILANWIPSCTVPSGTVQSCQRSTFMKILPDIKPSMEITISI